MKAKTMNKQLIAILVVSVIVLGVICSVAGQHNPHFEWNGCMCQKGGERGGHCHCPWDRKPPGVDCRPGSNHWICFPPIFGWFTGLQRFWFTHKYKFWYAHCNRSNKKLEPKILNKILLAIHQMEWLIVHQLSLSL